MTTLLAPFANLTVVFYVPSGEGAIGQDGVTNIPTNEQVVIAFVEQKASTIKRVEQIADGNEDSLALKGHWVSPSAAIRTLASMQKGDTILWTLEPGFSLPTSTGFTSIDEYQQFVADNETAIAMRAELLYLPSPPSPWGDEAVTGSMFQGIAISRSAWSNAV